MFATSVLYRMGVVILDGLGEALTANIDRAKIGGDLLRLYNSNMQMFSVHLSSSSVIWQTMAEFTVASSVEEKRDTSWQCYSYLALNYGGAHLLLCATSAFYTLTTQVPRR